jgi:hypothetical protein
VIRAIRDLLSSAHLRNHLIRVICDP